jgi:3-hydroxyacyl-[acyl-carrier-protein] dehydratase
MVFTGIDDAKFRAPVVPGDQVRIEIDVLKFNHRGATMRGSAYVGGKLVCEAEIRCQLVPRPTRKEPQPPEMPVLTGAAAE